MKGGEPGFTNWSRLEVGQAFHVVVVVHGDPDKLPPSGCFVVLETVFAQNFYPILTST